MTEETTVATTLIANDETEAALKKVAKTRTSITIDPEVLTLARKVSEKLNVSVSSLIEAALIKDLTPFEGTV